EVTALADRLRAEIDHQPVTVQGLGEVRARAAIGGALAVGAGVDTLLALARRAVEHQDGGIIVDGQERSPARDERPGLGRPPASLTGRAPLVVLVSGSRDLRGSLRDELGSRGCRLPEAQTAADSDARIAEDPPDVVVVDGAGPVQPAGDALTIVLGGDAVTWLAAGAFDVVPAGAAPAELVARIERAVRTKAERDDLAWRVADVEA